MRHIAFSIIVLTAPLVGCQSSGTSQVPAVDPFAMYGHTRIAPPSTGSYGVANRNPYYPGAAQAGASNADTMLAANTQVAPATSLIDATKSTSREVAQTSFETTAGQSLDTRVASNESPVRIVERVGPVSQSTADFRGMSVVDATASAPRLASQASSALTQASSSQTAAAQPAQFRAVESSTPIRVLPSSEPAERPLPVRGFSAPRDSQPNALPQPTPTNLRPSATIQAGRFIPLDIATSRNGSPQRETIVAATGN